jgi:LPXTG-motif cell wall-anchored protein
MLDPEKATTSASNFVMVIFMIAVPVLLVAMAVIVYFKRKNL